MRLKEQHEEKVQCLLQQIASKENSHEKTKEQFEEQLEVLRKENSKLNEQLKQLKDIFAADSPSPLSKKKNSLKTSRTFEVEDDEWAMGLSDESEAEDSTERDPDWVETPISPETPMVPCQRRFQRRTRSTEASSSLIKNSESVQGCSCTGKCATINCPCRKGSSSCSEDCTCKTMKCVNRLPKPLQAVPSLATITASDLESEPSPRSNVGGDERKALNEVKNIPLKNKKSDKKNMPSSIRPNGTENLLVPRKRPKVSNKPHSSSSVSSSDEDVVLSNQRRFSRPGPSPGRTVPVHGSLKKPGFSFGSAKKVIVKRSITKFNPETKRKRKLLKPVNTAPSLGVKP